MKKSDITDEELNKLAEWLRSDEGRKKIRENQEKADIILKLIEDMGNIDPKIWREPFNI